MAVRARKSTESSRSVSFYQGGAWQARNVPYREPKPWLVRNDCSIDLCAPAPPGGDRGGRADISSNRLMAASIVFAARMAAGVPAMPGTTQSVVRTPKSRPRGLPFGQAVQGDLSGLSFPCRRCRMYEFPDRMRGWFLNLQYRNIRLLTVNEERCPVVRGMRSRRR